MCVRLFLCCSSARTRFPLHSHTCMLARMLAQGKHLNSSTPNGKSWWVNFPSSHRRSSSTRNLFRTVVGTVFPPKSKIPASFFPPFFLPTNRPVLVLRSERIETTVRHTNYGGHERTDSLGFGLRCCCCWHWPNGRLGPASRSAYG